MFLIKAAFWLSLVILLIPGDPDTGREAPRVGAMQAFSAAQATVADMGAFCERNPDVCATGGAVAQVFADKARHGAQLIYDYFSEDEVGRGTLHEQDMRPAWRGETELEQEA